MIDSNHIIGIDERPMFVNPNAGASIALGAQVEASRYKSLNEDLEPHIDPIELARNMMKDWPSLREKAIKEGLAKMNGDFYIVMITKEEQLYTEVKSVFFITAQACPSPTYDQTVYKYHRAESKLEWAWTIPDLESCKYLMENLLTIDDPDMKRLRDFVIEFYNETLTLRAMKYNACECARCQIHKEIAWQE